MNETLRQKALDAVSPVCDVWPVCSACSHPVGVLDDFIRFVVDHADELSLRGVTYKSQDALVRALTIPLPDKEMTDE